MVFSGPSLKIIVPSWETVFAILLIGFVIGGPANILIYQAVVLAPNPGLPVAIAKASGIGVFLFAILLNKWLPNYFIEVKADALSFLGMFLVVIGLILIAIKR